MTTRGLKEKDFIDIANIIIKALRNYNNKEILKECKKEVLNITNRFPLSNIK